MSSPEAVAERVGEAPLRFGKYRLLRLLARGGMGEVYLAQLVGELGFEKKLVIKTILPELAAQPRFIELFAAEAKTAVALSHGNIVPIYELGRSGDTFYIVMGYVDGPSISELLRAAKRQDLAPRLDVALHVIRGVLTGLAYAHRPERDRAAVVHRDISPRNVLVDRSGQVRIVDFGIALPARVQVNVRAGSTGYMAPEQARAEAADPRADVFSTACLLYELATHQRAFPKEGVWTMPDLAVLPTTLRGPIERALSLEPADRPEDAAAFLQLLAPAIAEHAATFGDPDLAGVVQSLFPDGWDSTSKPAIEGGIASGQTGPKTETFATRLTAVTHVAPVPLEPAEPRPEASGRSPVGEELAASSSAAIVAAPPVEPPRRFPIVIALLGAAAGGAVAFGLAQMSARRDHADTPGVGVTARHSTPDEAPRPSRGEAPRPAFDPAPPAPQTEPPTHEASPLEDPAPATVRHRVHVRPADATATLDGRPLSGGPPFDLELRHDASAELVVERSGYVTRRFQVGPGAPPPETVVLERVKPKGQGWLKVVATSVPWAEVRINGKNVGVTPTRKLLLPEGEHNVEVRCVPDACSTERVLLRKKVRIAADETRVLQAE